MSRLLLPLALCVIAGSALANPGHAKVSKMNEAERRAFFAATLTTAKLACPTADKTFHQGGDPSGNAYWNVACSGGATYTVRIANNANGSTAIRDCRTYKPAEKPCFVSFGG